MKKVVVTDSIGEVHEFERDGVRFWHEDHICRVYISGVDNKSSETIGSFTNPVSVIIEKGD